MYAEAARRGWKRFVIIGLALLVTCASASCGRPAPKGGGTASAGTTLSGAGSCRVTVTGSDRFDVTATPDGAGTGVASVYWMTEQELRRYFEWKYREVEQESVADEDVGFAVDQAMARNPRFTPLLVKCWAGEITVTLVPGRGSRYEHIPFRPASYNIGPASEVDDAIPGYFAAQTSLLRQGKIIDYTPVGVGTLVVSHFDANRAAGTFAYDAETGPSKIRVTGSFDFRRQPPQGTAVEAGRR